jgi:hypothetical protein
MRHDPWRSISLPSPQQAQNLSPRAHSTFTMATDRRVSRKVMIRLGRCVQSALIHCWFAVAHERAFVSGVSLELNTIVPAQ